MSVRNIPFVGPVTIPGNLLTYEQEQEHYARFVSFERRASMAHNAELFSDIQTPGCGEYARAIPLLLAHIDAQATLMQHLIAQRDLARANPSDCPAQS